jgi:tetratricopeptide (TPR) repeat protein
LDPSNLEVRIKIAKTFAKKNFINKAFDELQLLKNEVPNYLPARIALGVLLYGCGKILEAQTEWEKILTKDPRNEEALMYLNLSRTATETSLT